MEKKKKRKVTALKKAIMRKKERKNLEAKRDGQGEDGNLSSGYVTIDEKNPNEEEFNSPEDFS